VGILGGHLLTLLLKSKNDFSLFIKKVVLNIGLDMYYLKFTQVLYRLTSSHWQSQSLYPYIHNDLRVKIELYSSQGQIVKSNVQQIKWYRLCDSLLISHSKFRNYCSMFMTSFSMNIEQVMYYLKWTPKSDYLWQWRVWIRFSYGFALFQS